MKEMTLVKLEGNDCGWVLVEKSDIEETIWSGGLREVSPANARKFNLVSGDAKSKFEDTESQEEFEEMLGDCDFVDCYSDGYIKLDEIKDGRIYFEQDFDKFFDGVDILEKFEKTEIYWRPDGANLVADVVVEKTQILAEEIERESYKTGYIATYITDEGVKFSIDHSFWQGALDAVIEEDIEFSQTVGSQDLF